jgi:intraflagellar transport protein 88
MDIYDFDKQGGSQSVWTSTASRLGSPHSHISSVATRALSRPTTSASAVHSLRSSTKTFAASKDEEEICPRDVARKMGNAINTLLEEVAALKRAGKFAEALDKAKEAVNKEDSLKRHRKEHALPREGQSELTFAVLFSVASTYEDNDMLDEAIKAYTYLTTQRDHPLSGRVRANLGNIYYAQHDYPSAIKMYKMALDQINNDRQTVASIRFNIGNAFFRQRHLRDAVRNFEESMNTFPNFESGFNLLVCRLALGDGENTKRDFMKLLKIRPNESGIAGDKANMLMDNSRVLLSAARLVSSFFDTSELTEALKDGHEFIAMKIEHEYAVRLLKRKDLKGAVKVLKTLEKKGSEMKALVATNLSFVHFLEGNVELASEYADIALNKDRYNADALVNKGNCYFVNEDFAAAENLYLEAIGVEAGCAQAIFNLGLTNVRLDKSDEAIQAFEKLHSITPNNPMAIYHIAGIYENRGQIENAIKWFNVLAAQSNNDATILSRLAYLYSKIEDDSSQSLHYHLESFRHNPVDLDVIAFIGAWFVQQEMFEKSIYFFQQAALVQPKEIKWGKWHLIVPVNR